MLRSLVLLGVALAAAACATVPPPDPITEEEVVQLSRSGAESPALVEALRTRPLGFPLTWARLKSLEDRGVQPEVLDAIVALTVENRARALAPRRPVYDPYWGPYWYAWPFSWQFGFGYHHVHCR